MKLVTCPKAQILIGASQFNWCNGVWQKNRENKKKKKQFKKKLYGVQNQKTPKIRRWPRQYTANGLCCLKDSFPGPSDPQRKRGRIYEMSSFARPFGISGKSLEQEPMREVTYNFTRPGNKKLFHQSLHRSIAAVNRGSKATNKIKRL